MPNPVWPTTLPVILYPAPEDNYNRAPESGVLRTSMDAGPVKMRRRFTAIVTPTKISLSMTQAQVQALTTFYRTTLQCVQPFDWVDLLGRNTATFRFVNAPSIVPVAADMWRVGLDLEMMP